MRLTEDDRDLVIITGCNAVGKTTASNFLRKLSSQYGITSENYIISDSECLLQAMLDDDVTGGHHHTHDWCDRTIRVHTHSSAQPIFPFTVTDNYLPVRMRGTFFSKIKSLQHTGNLWFAEWAAGVNTNSSDDSVSCIDYSYALVKKLILEGDLPSDWLIRVQMIIHVKADNSVRDLLNNKRSIPSFAYPAALGQGTASWLKDEKVLRFYGKDDFSEIECIFNKHRIPIRTLTNDGNSTFFQELEEVAATIFKPSRLKSDEAYASIGQS